LYQEAPKAKGVCIGLVFYTGEYRQLCQDPSLTAVCPTSKLGMPDIILPGFSRNDLFVMVEGGEYSKERKTAQKNVEVVMQLMLENGEVIKDAIFTGSEKPKPEQRSVVYYHSNQPHWNDTVRVVLPLAKLSQAYLVFYSRHVSTGEGIFFIDSVLVN
jgi:C2 domain in Dock180 and Zizimin proteins